MPVPAESVWPFAAVPVIVGGAVLAGAPAADTGAVCPDVALAVPYAFRPLTTTWMLEPTSAVDTR